MDDFVWGIVFCKHTLLVFRICSWVPDAFLNLQKYWWCYLLFVFKFLGMDSIGHSLIPRCKEIKLKIGLMVIFFSWIANLYIEYQGNISVFLNFTFSTEKKKYEFFNCVTNVQENFCFIIKTFFQFHDIDSILFIFTIKQYFYNHLLCFMTYLCNMFNMILIWFNFQFILYMIEQFSLTSWGSLLAYLSTKLSWCRIVRIVLMAQW